MSFPIHIVRHGEAGMAASDFERPLTDSGRKHVRQVAERFAARNEMGSLKILASPLKRAQQTAQIWADVLGMPMMITTEAGITPEGNVIQFARKLAEQNAAWLVVSHFPFVPSLASLLMTGQKERVRISVPTGTVISLMPDMEPGRMGEYRLLSVDN